MSTTTLKVTGMSCGHCKAAVERALQGHAGVKQATVDLERGAASVEYDETTVDPSQLVAAVEQEGYSAQIG